MSRIHRPPISLSRLVRLANKPGRQGRIICVVGSVTDDLRIYDVPKLTVSCGALGGRLVGCGNGCSGC